MDSPVQLYHTRFSAIFGPNYHALSFWKGRAALYAILQAMELGAGDEVILPGYTCVVVPNAVRHAGAEPVYADIEPGGFNLDPSSVKARITSRTRVLIVQHTYGIPADMQALQAIASQHGIQLIEDCAHVMPGSRYQGQALGSFGRAAFFSSQWSKPYTTGLGGIAVTGDETFARRLAQVHAKFDEPPFRQTAKLQIQYALYNKFYRPKLYWYSQKSLHAFSKLGIFVGSSSSKELTGERPLDIRWKMGEFQHRAGLTGIANLNFNTAHRQTLSGHYSDLLRRHDWPAYDYRDGGSVTLLRYPLQVENKKDLLVRSAKAGIELGSWFETPLHPVALDEHHLIRYKLGSCPVAEATADRVINLPLHERVSRMDADRIADFVLSNSAPAAS